MTPASRAAFDPTDIPTVTLPEIWLPMRIAIDAGRGLILMRSPSPDDRRTVEQGFWNAYRGDTARGTAILVRFWELARAMSSQRLQDKILHEGFAGLAPLLAAAASLRLNMSWGFVPQRLLWAMAAHREAAKPMRSVQETYVAIAPAALAA